ncbi:hypothetical protein B0H16DRAFT_1878376 [Mycena metata]|uniref:Uncharacterized protein n=1 Tax=Mycena metata TaxID=1033252 RepID=A0AAD7K709_9AGAR|nr:hypothetical protein B0H16DRAFT_1878376 [Mycena metata]
MTCSFFFDFVACLTFLSSALHKWRIEKPLSIFSSVLALREPRPTASPRIACDICVGRGRLTAACPYIPIAPKFACLSGLDYARVCGILIPCPFGTSSRGRGTLFSHSLRASPRRIFVIGLFSDVWGAPRLVCYRVAGRATRCPCLGAQASGSIVQMLGYLKLRIHGALLHIVHAVSASALIRADRCSPMPSSLPNGSATASTGRGPYCGPSAACFEFSLASEIVCLFILTCRTYPPYTLGLTLLPHARRGLHPCAPSVPLPAPYPYPSRMPWLALTRAERTPYPYPYPLAHAVACTHACRAYPYLRLTLAPRARRGSHPCAPSAIIINHPSPPFGPAPQAMLLVIQQPYLSFGLRPSRGGPSCKGPLSDREEDDTFSASADRTWSPRPTLVPFPPRRARTYPYPTPFLYMPTFYPYPYRAYTLAPSLTLPRM